MTREKGPPLAGAPNVRFNSDCSPAQIGGALRTGVGHCAEAVNEEKIIKAKK